MFGYANACGSSNKYYSLANAVRLFFVVLGTHILSGEVDTTLEEEAVVWKLSWLLRYFNPVNLTWRYYSIFAYRMARRKKEWGKKQMALLNFEAHPFKPPIPYISGELIEAYEVKRLEVSGIFSAQGLLSIATAYQGAFAVAYILSSTSIAFLPNLTMPLAILGLFRVFVSPWIASKLHVEPFTYPTSDINPSECKGSHVLACVWFMMMGGVVLLAFWQQKPLPSYHPSLLLSLSTRLFYQYISLSQLLFHVALLLKGASAFGNRIAYFDHWCYKLQTLVFYVALVELLVVGVIDFYEHH